MHTPKKGARNGPTQLCTHLASRFTVDGGRRGLHECPDGGIFLDASRIDLGDAAIAIVLVTDLAGVPGGRNCGMSASNAFASITLIYQDIVRRHLNVSEILWVERDSMGCFDRVLVNLDDNAPSITWQPLLSGAFPGRTEDDFIALFGAIAERALINSCAAVSLTAKVG